MTSNIHLTKGSSFPPLKKDILRCYSMKYCPYAQRALYVLAAKSIEHELINVATSNKPEWFQELTPLALVPVIQKGEKIFYESMVVMDFLDEEYPNPPLYPQDKWAKFQDKMLIELFDAKVMTLEYKIMYGKSNTKDDILILLDSCYKGLDHFETELAKRGTPFFFGQTPGILDFAIWPFFERVPATSLLEDNISLDSARFPLINKYMEDMIKEPAIQYAHCSPEYYAAFIKSFKDGKANYELVL